MTSLARRAHRVATHAYPPAFRARFASDLDRVFADRLSRAAVVSRFRASLLLVFLLVDTVISGLAERMRPASRRSPAMVVESLFADLRIAARHCGRSPMFTLLTTLSLAIGIGASTAIFSVVNAVLLRPLPYADPGRLVAIWSDNTTLAQPADPVSPANYEAFALAPSLARVEAMISFLISSSVQSNGQTDDVQIATITPGMFDLLGRPALLGSVFQRGERVPRVVLSYGYWQRRFGGDPRVVGRTIDFPGTPSVAIAGVMPPDFTFPYRSMLGPSGFTQAPQPDVWLPLVPTGTGSRYLDAAGRPTRTVHYLALVGRLAPGATIDRARGDLEAIAAQRAVEFPDSNRGWQVTVRPLRDQTVGAIRPALLILLGGVAIVLLITCVNVANVMLARAGARQRDLSVRSALGATAGRLTQHALVESVLLGFVGGLMGVGLAVAAVRGLLVLAPATLPRIGEVSIDLRVALFALVVSIGAGAIVGLAPALSASRAAAADALRDSRRTTVSAARRRLRASLVVAEVAMAMALAVGAGLLIRSFVAVIGVDPGFRTDGLLTMQLNVPQRSQTDQDARLAFYDSLETQLRAVAGVIEVGGTTRLPLGSTSVSTTVNVEGRSTPPNQMPEVEMRRAVFNFFAAMDIPLIRGRAFTPTDGPRAPIVAVVNTALVARVFQGEDPIGRRVRLGPDPTAPAITIVGVVGSLKHASLEEAPKPELYLYYRQNAPVQPFVVLRSATDPAALATAVREAVRHAGGDAPFDVKTMLEVRDSAVAERRFVLSLVAVFGVIALTLSAVGVYGVVTLVAAERAPEVGIRLALGAKPAQVLRLLLGQATSLALGGIVIGAVAGLFVAPSLSSQFFGVTPFDPATYATVAATLLVVATLAAYVPARRALRVDPATTLR